MQETLERIVKAIKQLIIEDKWLLKKDLSEQSISHKLGEKLTHIFTEYDVDCEYNGNCESESGKKRIEVLAQELKELDKLNIKEELEYSNSNDRNTLFYSRRVFPDIIIHKRKRNDRNHCIIELKKSTSTISYDSDKLKLKAYTTDYYGNELTE